MLLIDSRAGMDEIASACIAQLKADLILLFAIDSQQTWSGYRILFSHWRRTGAARDIRERLQLVGTMLPEKDRARYDASLLENAWNLFAEQLYHEVPAKEVGLDCQTDECFSYDKSSEEAPHFPWPVSWHPGFVALQSARDHFRTMQDETKFAFSRFVDKPNSLQKLRTTDEMELPENIFLKKQHAARKQRLPRMNQADKQIKNNCPSRHSEKMSRTAIQRPTLDERLVCQQGMHAL